MTKVIVLDAGHGGHDNGATGFGLREKNLALDRVLRLKKMFEDRYSDVKVVLTRNTDRFISLQGRCDIANRARADLFISDHKNAFNGSARGFETFIYNGGVGWSTRNMHDIMHKAIYDRIRKHGIPERRKDQANFAVLRGTQMSAILLEEGFLDNRQDNNLMQTEEFIKDYCEGVITGAAQFLGLTEKSAPVPKKEEPEMSEEQKVGAFAQEAQKYVMEQGISDGSRPKDAVTREELWVMIHRIKEGGHFNDK